MENCPCSGSDQGGRSRSIEFLLRVHMLGAGSVSADRQHSSRTGAKAEIPVRLTIVIAIVAVPSVLLSGCSPGDKSTKPLAAHNKKCEQLGFKRDTPEYAKCRLERAREATPRGASPAPAD